MSLKDISSKKRIYQNPNAEKVISAVSKEDTRVMSFNVPISLYKKFRSATFKNEVTMTQAVLSFMRSYTED